MDARRHLAHVKFETKAAGPPAGSTNELFDQLSSAAELIAQNYHNWGITCRLVSQLLIFTCQYSIASDFCKKV